MNSLNAWMEAYGQTVLRLLLIILLVFLIWLAVRLIFLVRKFSRTADKLNNDLDIAGDYLDDLKTPVRALVNVSMSVEALRQATEAQVRQLYDTISDSFGKIIEAIKTLIEQVRTKMKKDDGSSEEGGGEEVRVVKVKPAQEEEAEKTEESAHE